MSPATISPALAAYIEAERAAGRPDLGILNRAVLDGKLEDCGVATLMVALVNGYIVKREADSKPPSRPQEPRK